MNEDQAKEMIAAMKDIAAAITENTELVSGELREIRNMIGTAVDQMISQALDAESNI